MIDFVIYLVACMSPVWDYALTLIVALMFLATVPCIIRGIVDIYV